MVNFSELKKNSSSSFQSLNAQLQKMSSPQGGYDDKNEGYWYPEVDKIGNGYAIIRFLPAPPGEDLPFVRMYDHAFQGTGGWYIENSLSTLGQTDPVGEYNSKLWNDDGSNAAKDQARKQKRRLTYHANIYVVKDPATPANEGKVFKYRFGKKIFDKLNDLMNPQYPDESPINPFDLWAGANFNLKIRQVEGYRNYDKSDFSSPAPLLSDDDTLEAIWKQEYSLQEIIHPSKFKSYDELKARLHKVLQLDSSMKSASQYDMKEMQEESKPEMSFTPKFAEKEVDSSVHDSGWKNVDKSADDEDDLQNFFNSLGD